MKPETTSVLKSITNLLLDQEIILCLKTLWTGLTLLDTINAVELKFYRGLEQFDDLSDYQAYCDFVDNLKGNLEKLYRNEQDWITLSLSLQTFSNKLWLQPKLDTRTLTPLSELLKEPEIQELLTCEKARLKRGQLLDCSNVFPASYFSANENGIFLKAETDTLIRRTFGYYKERVPSLVDIGFILAPVQTVILLVKNIETGEMFVSRKLDTDWRVSCFHDHSIRGMKRLRGFYTKEIKYKEIVGINLEFHRRKIKELNEQHDVLMAKAHAIPHKPHKEHAAHKQHKQARIFLDEEGNFVTAFEYSKRHGVSRPTAYARLKKLNELNHASPSHLRQHSP